MQQSSGGLQHKCKNIKFITRARHLVSICWYHRYVYGTRSAVEATPLKSSERFPQPSAMLFPRLLRSPVLVLSTVNTPATKQTTWQAKEVALDATTGDFYAFDFKTDRWVAEGNVGSHKTGAGIGGVAGAILADASGALGEHGSMSKVCRKSANAPPSFAV